MSDRLGTGPVARSIYGVPLVIVGLATLFILYPGILSPDSLDQWRQARGLHGLEDWHPVLDTLWVRLWSFADTPALPIAIQIFALAGVVAFACRLQRSSGIPLWVVALEAALIAIWPSTIAFEATLWKDVPYSIAVLAGTALLYQLSQSRAAAGRRPVQMGLGICMFGAAAFRHNGVVAALCMMAAAILLAWPERRRLLGVAVISLACWAGLRAIAQKMNDVIPVPPGYVAVGYLAAHVAAGTPLNPEEARLVDAIHPLAGGWPYVCGQTDPVTYDGKFNGFGLIREGWTPVWLVAKLTFRRPGPTFRHFRCASRFIWDPTFEQLIGPAIWYDAGKGWTVPPGWAVVALPPSPGLRRWLLGGLLKSLEPRMIELFWSPAWALFLIILASGLVALLEKDWAPLIVFLPILGQTLALAAVAPMPQVRYQFAVLLVAFLFVPGLLYRRLVPHGRPLEAPA